MTARSVAFMIALSTGLIGPPARAQQPPPVRQLGRLERVTVDSLASAREAIALAGGTVLVNDVIGRRLLLFDSTLTHMTVVADTTSATADAYGSGRDNLIRFRGDTALLIDVASLSMFVIGPTGSIGRILAVPQPNDAQALLGGFWGGPPGFDTRGRLVYFGGLNSLPGVLMLMRGRPLPTDPRFTKMIDDSRHIDSSLIVRADLATRVIDTAAWIRVPKGRRELKTDAQGMLVAIETTPDPLPVVDDWTVMPDGTVALVRGLDYHVDWLDADGRVSRSPKLPFDWQKVTDERKEALIDSTVKQWQADFDNVAASRNSPGRGGGGGGGGRGGGSGGRGGGGGGADGGGPRAELAAMVAKRPALNDLTDYMPPFSLGSTRADADGNLWIRTTTMVKGQPVYDIVNRRDGLIDRVQLPAFRTIAGFGPGVVYMAVKDAAGVVHVERARVK
jgi:uncharacterized membrane protein YgcG